jgi:hypothetical protein
MGINIVQRSVQIVRFYERLATHGVPASFRIASRREIESYILADLAALIEDRFIST